MFGRKIEVSESTVQRPVGHLAVVELQRSARNRSEPLKNKQPAATLVAQRPKDARDTDEHDLKSQIFGALIEIIDVSQLTRMDIGQARAEIRDVVSEVVNIKKMVMSAGQQEQLLESICDDVLGYGPLEPLLARDEIADIMVNGSNRIFIEVGGKVTETDIR